MHQSHFCRARHEDYINRTQVLPYDACHRSSSEIPHQGSWHDEWKPVYINVLLSLIHI